jgi:hypothetical protein
MAEIDARRPHGGMNQATLGRRRTRSEAIVAGLADWVRTLVSRYDPDVLLEPGRRLWVELRALDSETSGPERAAA